MLFIKPMLNLILLICMIVLVICLEKVKKHDREYQEHCNRFSPGMLILKLSLHGPEIKKISPRQEPCDIKYLTGIYNEKR